MSSSFYEKRLPHPGVGIEVIIVLRTDLIVRSVEVSEPYTKWIEGNYIWYTRDIPLKSNNTRLYLPEK